MVQTCQLWLLEGYHESTRCSRDTYPESYITKFTSDRSHISPCILVYKEKRPQSYITEYTSIRRKKTAVIYHQVYKYTKEKDRSALGEAFGDQVGVLFLYRHWRSAWHPILKLTLRVRGTKLSALGEKETVARLVRRSEMKRAISFVSASVLRAATCFL